MTTKNPKNAPISDETVEEVVQTSDVQVLSGEPDENGVLTLSSGSRVRLVPMKTREIFKLLKIFTVGAAGLLSELSFSLDEPEKFAGEMIGLLITAIPEAEDEAIQFIQAMVLPEDFIDRPRTKEQRHHNEVLLDELFFELQNPEPEDSFAILAAVIKQEAPNMLALGKRIAAMFNTTVAQVVAKN